LARKRFVRIALIPILAPLFLTGWLLAFFGEQKAEARKSRQRSTREPKKDDVEIGLLAEVTGEPLEVPLKLEDAA
jgi:hypothetical protein